MSHAVGRAFQPVPAVRSSQMAGRMGQNQLSLWTTREFHAWDFLAIGDGPESPSYGGRT